MADTDPTKIVISIETILKNLDRTLKGLSTLEKQLQRIGTAKVGQGGFDKAAAQAIKLQQQQQKLLIQSQRLANQQEKERQQADRLALAQLKLEQSFNRLAAAQKRVSDTSAKTAQANAAKIQQINQQTRRQAAEQERIRSQAARNLADVEIRESLRSAQFVNRIFGDNQEKAKEFAKSMESVGNSFRSLGQGLITAGIGLTAGLTVPLVALGKSSLDASITLDSLRRGLTAIAGSAQRAQIELQRLTEIAKLPGIGFQEAIQGSIRLQAVGFSAREAERALIQFSNAVALTGGGRDELARVTVQLGQLSAKGKVLAQDLRPIIEAAPAVGQALLKAFGTVNAEDIADLSGSSKEFLETLVAQLEELPRAASGARNAFDNFKDSVFQASTALGDALLPILTQVIDVALPVIQKLADAFRTLPAPIQTAIVVIGALLTALGPILTVSGFVALAFGRLTVALAQLSLQAGEATTSMGALSLAMNRTGVAAAGLASRFAGAATGILAGLTVLAIVGPELGRLFQELAKGTDRLAEAEERAAKITDQVVSGTKNQIATLEDQIKAVNELNGKVSLTTEEQQLLDRVYQSLNQSARERVDLARAEGNALAQLRKELVANLALRKDEQAQQTATLVTTLAVITQEVQANLQRRALVQGRIQENQRLRDELAKTGIVTRELAEALRREGIEGVDAAQAIEILRRRSLALTDVQSEAITQFDGLTEKGRILGERLRELGVTNRDAIRSFVLLAKSLGADIQGNIEDVVTQLEKYINATDRATDATGKFKNRLDNLFKDSPLVKAAESADAALDRTIKLLSLTSRNAFEARTALRTLTETFPEIKAAVDRAGGLEKVVEKILGVKAVKDAGTSLRNAKERFAEQMKDLTESVRDKTRATEEAADAEQLQAQELSFAQRLSSYREYLTTRQDLTTKALDAEIRDTEAAVKAAQDRAKDLRISAQTPGIPQVERINRQTQAAKQDQEAIEAQTKLIQLQSKRNDIINQTAKSLAEATDQQDENIRQLQIEAGKLRGDLVSALQAEGVEPFLKRLKELSNELAFINQRLRDETGKVTAEEKEALRVAQERNKTETELILKRIRTSDAQAVLGQAEKNVTEAKEEQRNLEEDLAFQVDFRGRKELDAIRERLKGEEQLKQTLLINRDIVQAQIDALKADSRLIPEEMQKFVEQMNRDVQSLGRLPFAEQFRIAEIEFNRINDERLDKIAEVEDAINRRTIAEIQGLLRIRLINAEYVGDLEEQSRILTEIAKQSNDPRLIQQARQVEQTTRDANTELEDFNTQLRSVSIDALQQGLADFFSELGDNTKTAKERVLDLVNSITRSITDFIAQDFSRRIIESIFGTGGEQAGAADSLITTVKRLLGIGGGGGATESAKAVDTGFGTAGKAAETGQITAAATALSTAGTTTAAALTTGGTSAAAAMTTGGASFATSVFAAGAGFATAVATAGAAFVAAITAASAVKAAGDIGSSLAGAAGAATGMYPATPGGIVRIVEGGYPEAVLTTDPRHASQQVRILQRYLKETKGLFGRIPGFAQGGFDIARDAEAEMLQSLSNSRSGIPAPSPSLQPVTSGGDTNLRILNLWDRKQIAGGYIRSSEGARDIMNVLSENASEVSRRISIK